MPFARDVVIVAKKLALISSITGIALETTGTRAHPTPAVVAPA